MKQLSFLPELDRRKTQKAVEAAFEKYRLYKYLSFEERDVSTTTSYDPRYHGSTNVTSDQTAKTAIYNVDVSKEREEYCKRVEWAVNKLPRIESFLIRERYMAVESEYITDQNVYNFKFDPPISEGKYSKIRWKAFYKLALDLKLERTMEAEE
ncbi:transcriptional regulator [Brevibacillus laterosporus]|uniref:Transcriptional regulator n=1 Tax=Brevibacillus halotolerans TaxID=1507437 RepID=A0ABT4HY98_9BACL|nr:MULTISPECIES: ArpU family phage packaging/lysis transcriptional regulator [Brevibacillus]MCR8986033.1 transcriptional regulator [Brevibacillus laterosporus]MCZ0831766.1 transcriptional regulator [Brevibacillus halotolerans]